MTISADEATIRKQREDVVARNEMKREQALLALDRLIRERLASGMPGVIGIRIPFNRNRLGSIRAIREDDLG